MSITSVRSGLAFTSIDAFSWPGDFARIPDEEWTRQPVDQFGLNYDDVGSHGWYKNLEPTVAQVLATLAPGGLLVDYSSGTGISTRRLGGRVVRPEPVMTLPRSAADVLADHVLFEIEAIDRMYLNLYQPRLQHGAGIAAFFVGHRGHRFASSALMAPMTAAFTADIGHFVAARGLDLVRSPPASVRTWSPPGTCSAQSWMTGGWCPPRCCMREWRRKSRRCSGPASGATRSAGPPTRGWCRAPTPGRYRTRVITEGVTPACTSTGVVCNDLPT
jgi:hypothetical protein